MPGFVKFRGKREVNETIANKIKIVRSGKLVESFSKLSKFIRDNDLNHKEVVATSEQKNELKPLAKKVVDNLGLFPFESLTELSTDALAIARVVESIVRRLRWVEDRTD